MCSCVMCVCMNAVSYTVNVTRKCAVIDAHLNTRALMHLQTRSSQTAPRKNHSTPHQSSTRLRSTPEPHTTSLHTRAPHGSALRQSPTRFRSTPYPHTAPLHTRALHGSASHQSYVWLGLWTQLHSVIRKTCLLLAVGLVGGVCIWDNTSVS